MRRPAGTLIGDPGDPGRSRRRMESLNSDSNSSNALSFRKGLKSSASSAIRCTACEMFNCLSLLPVFPLASRISSCSLAFGSASLSIDDNFGRFRGRLSEELLAAFRINLSSKRSHASNSRTGIRQTNSGTATCSSRSSSIVLRIFSTLSLRGTLSASL